MRLLRTLATLAALAAALPAAGQTGRIEGAVVDSLGTPRPFGGAEVWVVGTPHRAIADADGRFRIDGVPAGPHTVGLFHASLDSLSLGVPPVAVQVESGRTARIQLATPSGAALFARACGRRPELGEGVALGVVREVTGDAPVPGAMVAASWIELPLPTRSVKISAELQQKVASTTADDRGQFILCGVPSDLEIDLAASADSTTSGLLPLSLGGRSVSMSTLHLGRGTPSEATGVAEGRVRTPDGEGVPGAAVMLDGSEAAAFTDSAGRFVLRGLPTGTQVLFVRGIGWAPRREVVVLRPGRPTPVEMVLERTAAVLPTVSVVGRAASVRGFIGFEQRRRGGFGLFLTPDDVERWRASGTMGMLRTMPRVRVARTRSVGDEEVLLERFGGLCSPDVWIDGAYQRPAQGTLEQMIPGMYVKAIEVYRGIEVPSQFQRPNYTGGQPCGAIVIWSRTVEEAQQR